MYRFWCVPKIVHTSVYDNLVNERNVREVRDGLTPIFENPTYHPNMLCYELTRKAMKDLQKKENGV